MNLAKTNQAFNHKITGGSEFQWDCYPDARYLDYESDYAHGSVLFNTETQEVYCAEVTTKEHKYQYRWLNPEYKQDYYDECKKKKVDPDKAWDEVKWTDLETEEDFLEKANAIFEGRSFDERVLIPVEFDDELLMTLFKEAHRQDITFNQLMERALQNLIDEFERNPDAVKARMDERQSTN